MHATTQKLELVDTSADPKNSRWMQPMTVILELVDANYPMTVHQTNRSSQMSK